MFDIVGKRRWFFLFSLIITIPGLFFILLTPLTNGAQGLKFSIDYTGGTEWSIKFADTAITAQQVQEELAALGQEEAQVTRTGRGFYDIRMSKLDLREVPPAPTAAPSASPGASGSAAPSASPAPTTASSPAPSASPSPTPSPTAAPTASPAPTTAPGPSQFPGSANLVPTQGEIGEIAFGLQEKFGPITEQAKLSSIGAVVSADLIQQAAILILVGSLGILAWITLRFRDVKFGVTALVALLHDVIVVIGIFAILGTLLGVKIDGLFVTAMLTVIGFSVHDTIVVFDRIREVRGKSKVITRDMLNLSINQTLSRTILTGLTTMFVLIILYFWGGTGIHGFAYCLFVGMIVGTYSSIYVASPILLWLMQPRGGASPQGAEPKFAKSGLAADRQRA